MIKVRSDKERSVYADLKKRPEVRDVYRLFGEYDFFLVMQADGEKKVRSNDEPDQRRRERYQDRPGTFNRSR